MKSSEFISTNSLGKPIRNYNNFKLWFKNSVAVDSNNRPLVVYHGTGNDFDEFNIELRSKYNANDQYGPGYYTATNPIIASGYAYGHNPNVIPLYVSIQKPLTETTVPFNKSVIKALIINSPYYEDALTNFGDTSYENKNVVLNRAINAYTVYDNAIHQMQTILGDFWYTTKISKFLSIITKLTGYDGVTVKPGNENSGKFYIAWQPYQLKSVTGNNGEYSINNNTIIKEVN